MDRLFFRIQAHIVIALLIASSLCIVFIMPRINAQINHNLEENINVPYAIIAEVLEANHSSEKDMRALLEQASNRFKVPFSVVRRNETNLGTEELSRLDRGEVVRKGERAMDTLVFVHIQGTNDLMRIGPLKVTPPLGKGRGILIAILLFLAVSIAVHWFLRPIRQRLNVLGQTATALGRGELGSRAPEDSRDALGDLGRAFNRMADEIQRLVAAREELLRMTSHELRTPIQRLHFGIENIRDAQNDAERDKACQRIDRDLEELDRLIEELLTYVRLENHHVPVRASVLVRAILDELVETLAEMRSDVTLTSRMSSESDIRLDVESRLLRRALSNLVLNAQRHARSRIEIVVFAEKGMIRIDVDDDGPGVPIADRTRIFDPFQRLDDERTKNSRGFGLGLAIVRRIAELHGGKVIVLTSDWGGARFRLSLPTHVGR